MGATLRLLLADDHKMMRDGLRALIAQQPGMEIVGEASTGIEMLALAEKTAPDIVVMDVTMPELNGIEATRRLLATNSHTKVVALSVHTDRRYVTAMFEAGASAYLPKNAAFEELWLAISAVMRGQLYLSPSVTGVVVESFLRNKDAATATALTAREREVLQLLAEGNSSKEIAAKLNVSVTTVETQRRQIGARLGLHSVAELTKYAIREGLTSLDD